MKHIKLLVLFFTVTTALFYSCSESNSQENEQIASKSSALRTVLNELKVQNNISGRTVQSDVFCFDFVFPITLSYSDGTTVSIASPEQLLNVLTTENNNVFIDGIVFPFEVVVNATGANQEISNEADFWTLVDGCNFTTYDDLIVSGPCFEFIYPFSVVTIDEQTIAIPNEQALNDLFAAPSSTVVVADFVYPFSVIYNNETYVVNNSYDFSMMNANCSSNCNCPDDYTPVCVDLGNEMITFTNACVAECFGYTVSQFVDCNNSGGPGDVATFENTLDTCLDIVYPVQVQYNGVAFNVTSDAELVQLYDSNTQPLPLFDYPIVVSFSSNPTVTYTVANENALLDLIQSNCD